MYPFYEKKETGKNFYLNCFQSDSLNFPPHLHSYVELIYVEEGEIKVCINDRIQNLKAGEIGFSFPNDIHSYETAKSSKAILVIFSPEIINGFFSNKTDLTLIKPYFGCGCHVEDFIKKLYEEFSSSGNELVIKGLLYAIFGKMEEQFKFENKRYVYDNTIQLLLNYIGSHYLEDISLDSVAKALGFSKFYISRLFSNKVGYQFNEYINRLRINLAQALLSEGDMSILNIALECGFESQRNFNRVFKSYTTLTPSKYKKLQN